MKRRLGFVSNSSSSSFIIIGKEIEVKDLDKYKDVYFEGKEFGEGSDIFLLGEEDKALLKEKGLPMEQGYYHNLYPIGRLIASFKSIYDNKNEFNAKEFIDTLSNCKEETFSIFNLTKSDHSNSDLIEGEYYEN